MLLDDIRQDIRALKDELRAYERKYGVTSETFYESYVSGKEPPGDTRVRDWTAWDSAYKVWLRRRERYQAAIQSLQVEAQSFSQLIEKTARHEPVPIPA